MVGEALAEFEGSKAEEGEEEGHDPEADDDSVFFPAAELEVVVERGHAEDAFAGELEAGDLKDDREGFCDEDAADDDEEDFLFGCDGDDAEEAADGEGAGIAHKDAGGVAVPPEEAEAGAEEGHADDGEFAGEGDVGDLEVSGGFGVAGEVSEGSVGGGNGGGATGGEAVEAVGEIDCVGGADDD